MHSVEHIKLDKYQLVLSFSNTDLCYCHHRCCVAHEIDKGVMGQDWCSGNVKLWVISGLRRGSN
jgi:hypothetical protein